MIVGFQGPSPNLHALFLLVKKKHTKILASQDTTLAEARVGSRISPSAERAEGKGDNFIPVLEVSMAQELRPKLRF